MDPCTCEEAVPLISLWIMIYLNSPGKKTILCRTVKEHMNKRVHGPHEHAAKVTHILYLLMQERVALLVFYLLFVCRHAGLVH